jgi:hypothetical protein
MKSEQQWKTYRTRFLVKARQLDANLSFIDNLGRQQSGRKGDYLVESSEGVISIAPRQIFEDIYVQMAVERLRERDGGSESRLAGGHNRRKLPQPCRERTASAGRIGLV